MAAIERKSKRCPTNLTDEEWARIAPLLPKPAKRGRKPEVDLREVLNAIGYMARLGGAGLTPGESDNESPRHRLTVPSPRKKGCFGMSVALHQP